MRLGEPLWVRGEARWIGAGDGIRTRDIDLGKVALYQLSYSRPVKILIVYQREAHCQL